MEKILQRISKKENIICILVIVVSSTIGILFLSGCSSLFPWYIQDDKDIFLTIGKYWASGQAIPYIDLFDHKGPMIFLLNALGFVIGNGKMYGMVVVEVCFLIISEYFAYKILKFKFSHTVSLLLSAAMPILFVYNFVPGNFTEEYMLPFLFMSFYYCLKWQGSNTKKHNPLYAFVYGMSFGFALMTRITNALSVCIIVLLILIELIKNKEWKNIFNNAFCFTLGALLLIVPFYIYFASKNALYDMWYATLLYNFDYTSNSGLTFELTIKDIVLLIRMTFAGVLACAICLYKAIFEKNQRNLFWLIVALPSTLFMYMLNRYANYSLILIPFVYIFFIEIDGYNKFSKTILCSVLLLYICSSVVKINKLNNLNSSKPSGNEYIYLLNKIPANELENNFVAIDPPVDFYLQEDIKPCSKYFIFQSWQSSNSSKLKDIEIAEIENNRNIHYLLTFGNASMFIDAINNNYSLIDSIKGYNLYKRNDK